MSYKLDYKTSDLIKELQQVTYNDKNGKPVVDYLEAHRLISKAFQVAKTQANRDYKDNEQLLTTINNMVDLIDNSLKDKDLD